jgi:hypothetical protein
LDDFYFENSSERLLIKHRRSLLIKNRDKVICCIPIKSVAICGFFGELLNNKLVSKYSLGAAKVNQTYGHDRLQHQTGKIIPTFQLCIRL